jgi:Zn-dependent protease with chaperone function
MKKTRLLAVTFCLAFTACVSNPLTGKNTIALVNSDELLASSFRQYSQFLSENTVISGTAEALMVERVGKRIREAAEKRLNADGKGDYLRGYEWEYRLAASNEVNAWCMPGGKIVVYSGILPVTRTETALAVVMGHEVSHALLNHGQQRMSALSGGSTPEFLSTHPSDERRIKQLGEWTAGAKAKAAEFGIVF